MVSACGPVVCVEKLEQWMPPSYGGSLVGADIIRPLCSGRLQKGTWGFRLRAGGNGFACGRVPFAAVQKEPKDRRGRLTGIYNALSRLPRTPCFFYGGATKGRDYIHPAREKTRIPLLAPPATALCWLNWRILLQEPSRLAFIHRGAVRWSLRLRGWCRMCKTTVNTHLLQVHTRQRFRRPQVHSVAGPSKLPSPGGYIQ